MICAVGSPLINDFSVSIFKLHLCSDKLLAVDINLRQFNGNRLVNCTNRDSFAVLANSYGIAFITENISCGSFDFMNHILAVGDLIKLKISVFIGNSGHICVFRSEFGSINCKQSEKSIFKRFIALIYLDTLDFSAL